VLSECTYLLSVGKLHNTNLGIVNAPARQRFGDVKAIPAEGMNRIRTLSSVISAFPFSISPTALSLA
jgi:hypothetical protein